MSRRKRTTTTQKLATIFTTSSIIFLAGCEPQQEATPSDNEPDIEIAVLPEPIYASAGLGAQGGEWQAYGADISSTKYTSLAQIDATNVNELEIVWRRPAVDGYYLEMNPNQRYSTTWNAAPVIKNNVAYITNGLGLVEAYNPGNGETIWVQEPAGGLEGLPGAPTRGVAYWSDGTEERILVQRGIYLYALNAQTGELFPDFGVNGRVDLQLMPPEFTRFRWGGAPMVV
ncbi:MAG: hypothetical protein MK299_12430, partial [Pseudomonadales bacterium]|nr:hypothetical protein [Pseudomonadales bacterium]